MTYEITITKNDGSPETFRVELLRAADSGRLQCRVNGELVSDDLDVSNPGPDTLSILLAGTSYEVRRDAQAQVSRIVVGNQSFEYELRDPRSLGARRAKAGAMVGPKKITAPMPGKVVRILVAEGTEVEAGQGVIVIEAMKMQNELKSPKKGIVKKILAIEGATVNAGDGLAVVE